MIDWDCIDLVVFDVDGTLYDAARLRRAMLRPLMAGAWNERSLRTLHVLHTFRRVREALGNEESPDFMTLQYERTAARTGCPAGTVRALVREWMEQRPLPLLRACRRPGVEAVFAALRAAGKQVGVLSDYPAEAKLRALGLRAEVVVAATDEDVACLKPHPRGLHQVLQRTGVPAARALMIGDRVDRDAVAARRAGVGSLIVARAAPTGVPRVRRFDDPLFAPLFAPPLAGPVAVTA